MKSNRKLWKIPNTVDLAFSVILPKHCTPKCALHLHDFMALSSSVTKL